MYTVLFSIINNAIVTKFIIGYYTSSILIYSLNDVYGLIYIYYSCENSLMRCSSVSLHINRVLSFSAMM